MGVWIGGDSFTYRNEGGVNQDEFVWRQNLENWRRVDAGLTDSEDVKYAKKFFSYCHANNSEKCTFQNTKKTFKEV